MQKYRLSLAGCFAFVLAVGLAAAPAGAEVSLDGTLGKAGALPGPDYAITADLGRQVGANLFHSFTDFSLAQGESATFSGPASVRNILARVTGGQPSTIDGLLRSEIIGADLYLLNPAGVIFGPHASLDLKGSFHVSTADYLRLGETGRFDARHPADSELSAAPPADFGFLDDSPAEIRIAGSHLTVPEGQALGMTSSGKVTIEEGSTLVADYIAIDAHDTILHNGSIEAPKKLSMNVSNYGAGTEGSLSDVTTLGDWYSVEVGALLAFATPPQSTADAAVILATGSSPAIANGSSPVASGASKINLTGTVRAGGTYANIKLAKDTAGHTGYDPRVQIGGAAQLSSHAGEVRPVENSVTLNPYAPASIVVPTSPAAITSTATRINVHFDPASLPGMAPPNRPANPPGAMFSARGITQMGSNAFSSTLRQEASGFSVDAPTAFGF